jgi:predicted nucleic acid-binding protein
MAGIVFDTSVYIAALRQGDSSLLSLRRASRLGAEKSLPLWLSVVVLEELYVGAADSKARKIFEAMEYDFTKIGRLLVPQRTDWVLAGQILSNVGKKYGYDLISKSRMTNDALIAMSVANRGFTVFTKNANDFQKISEFRRFQWLPV